MVKNKLLLLSDVDVIDRNKMSEVLPENGVLPLSSLRLLVPPLQLLSAVLWGIVQQRAVMHYGLLEDFITAVLDNIPELLTYSERVQLVIGLRAKVVLEMCRSDGFCNRQNIEPHLRRISACILEQHGEVKPPVENFIKVVHTMLDYPHKRNMFYQKTFPAVFGLKFDSALKALVRKFLHNLQKLLPVPSLEQTSLWLGLSPSILKECLDILAQPEPLSKLIQHHKHGHKILKGHLVDDFILASLSGHSLNIDTDDTDVCESKPTQNESSELHLEAAENEKQNEEDYVPSVEVTLPFDDTDGHNLNRDMKHQRRQSGSRKIFRCLVCGQNFGSFQKLKRHSNSKCSTNTDEQNNINLYSKPIVNTGDYAWRGETEHISIGNRTVSKHSVPTLDNFYNDNLVCHLCGQVYTYERNFIKHQKVCVERTEQEKQPEAQCSTSSCQQVKPEISDNTTTQPVRSEAKSMSSEPQQSVCSDSSVEQTCKRSSRIKTCSICGQGFTSSTDVTNHMRCHTNQSNYICGHCGKDFDNYEDYKSHQEHGCKSTNEHQVNVYSTQENHSTSVSFKKIVVVPRRISPNTAVSQKESKFVFTCSDCGQSFIYSKSFEKHQSKCLKKNSRRKRQIIISSYSNLIMIDACSLHSLDSATKNTTETEIVQTSKEPENTAQSKHMKCTQCDKTFSELVLMKRHYSVVHKLRGAYPCPVCKRTFVRLCELVKHHQSKQLFQCVTCKRCFTKPSQLCDHEKVHSKSSTPHVCETCGKSCKTAALLKQHQNKHKGENTTVCSYCGKQFSTKYCLQAHMVRHTSGFSCPTCGKVFFQKTYLKWHMYKHNGQDPYLCETCGKGWPTATQLKIHMVEHTQERPFKCEECGVSYKRESHVKAHYRAKHMKLRPFVCSVCSKAFRLNGQLKKHMIVHTGDRPFTCTRCGKTFARKTRLKEHRETRCL